MGLQSKHVDTEFGLLLFANKLGLGSQQVSLKQNLFEDARNSVRTLL